MIQYLFQISSEVFHSTVISFLSGHLFLIVGLYVLVGWIFEGNEMGLGIWLSHTFAQGLVLIYALAVFFVKGKRFWRECCLGKRKCLLKKEAKYEN